MKHVLVAMAAVAVAGCGMSDQAVKEATGNAAVAAKHAAEATADKMKEAYDAASVKGKELAAEAGKAMSDGMLKAKVLAAFKLIEGLDASNVTVEAANGSVTLTGTVPTEMDKMKVEGVAFGVTGDLAKVNSSVSVAKKG